MFRRHRCIRQRCSRIYAICVGICFRWNNPRWGHDRQPLQHHSPDRSRQLHEGSRPNAVTTPPSIPFSFLIQGTMNSCGCWCFKTHFAWAGCYDDHNLAAPSWPSAVSHFTMVQTNKQMYGEAIGFWAGTAMQCTRVTYNERKSVNQMKWPQLKYNYIIWSEWKRHLEIDGNLSNKINVMGFI